MSSVLMSIAMLVIACLIAYSIMPKFLQRPLRRMGRILSRHIEDLVVWVFVQACLLVRRLVVWGYHQTVALVQLAYTRMRGSL